MDIEISFAWPIAFCRLSWLQTTQDGVAWSCGIQEWAHDSIVQIRWHSDDHKLVLYWFRRSLSLTIIDDYVVFWLDLDAFIWPWPWRSPFSTFQAWHNFAYFCSYLFSIVLRVRSVRTVSMNMMRILFLSLVSAPRIYSSQSLSFWLLIIIILIFHIIPLWYIDVIL